MEPEAVLMKTRARGRLHSLGRRLAMELAPHEVFMLVFAVFLSVFSVCAFHRVTAWPQVLLYMFVASLAIFVVNLWESQVDRDGGVGKWSRRIRILYLFPALPIYFKTVELISFPLHGHDYDAMLIAVDRMMFGVNPTYWLAQHIPTWPWLTEYLMICYASFYFLPFALTIEMYRRSRRRDNQGRLIPFHFGGILDSEQVEPVEQVIFIVVYAFLFSYLGYIFLPAIGPRFTLHNFNNISRDLPGLWLTEPLRALLDRGENIVPSMNLTQIFQVVTRDAFPSGHTDITALTILLAFQFRSKFRWAIAIIGVSLIFSTVYLRYHYVIDLIGGLVMATVTLYTWRWVREQMLLLRARFIS